MAKGKKVKRATDNESEADINKIALWSGRLVLMSAGVVFWLSLFDNILGWGAITTEQLSHTWQLICRISGSVLFALALFFSAGAIINGLVKLYRVLERGLSKYSARQIVMGVVGMIIGLSIILILNLIFLIIEFSFPLPLTILLCVILGFLGMMLGARRMSEVIIAPEGERQADAGGAASPKILDSSAIIDGRILDVARTGFVEGPFIVPEFILTELRRLTDNADVLKRNRGKRGIDIINALQHQKNIEVVISSQSFEDGDTDAKLLALAQLLKGKIITNDYNLNKIAGLKNISVLNINELNNAIKPVALPGEKITIKLVKEGKEAGQAVGYLDDGTMIVVENGGKNIGEEVEATITTALQTNAGRMIFARIF